MRHVERNGVDYYLVNCDCVEVESYWEQSTLTQATGKKSKMELTPLAKDGRME